MTMQPTRREVILGGVSTLLFPKMDASVLAEQLSLGPTGSRDPGFPFGAHIYREPSLPLEQYVHDLPLLKRLGLNMVKIQEVWAANERREGEIDLSRITEVIAKARENQLLVYFGVTMEAAPAWLWRKYPDARMVLRSGEPLIDDTQYVLPEDGKPGPCWHHPGARAAAESFLERLARRLGEFDNILVWNVWQELGLDPQAQADDAVSISYSPFTLAAYRTWLRTRYPSLDQLNKSWCTFFGNWDEVEPPRRFQQVPSFIDWRMFMVDIYLSETLHWKSEAIKRNDPLHRPVMAHVARVDPIGSRDWAYARKVDIFGGSFYPGWGERELPGEPALETSVRQAKVAASMCEIALSCDVLRGASGGRFWAAEVQGGRAPGGLFPGRIPDAADIRRWVMMLLAGGAQGICFWNHRDEMLWSEAYGFGLLNTKGDSTERGDEAGRISRAIQSRGAQLLREGVCPHAPLAIVVNEDMRSFLSAGGDSLFVSNLRSLHRGLWLSGIQVDFVDIEQILKSPYRVLLLPNALSLSDENIDVLSGYVESGGTLVAEAGIGRFTRYGMARNGRQAAALAALFGVEPLEFTTLPQVDPADRSATAAVTLDGAGVLQGMTIEASVYIETVLLRTASAISSFRGVPVGARNRFGKGEAVRLGTLAGASFDLTHASVLRRLVPQLELELDPTNRAIRRRRLLGEEEAWFLINPWEQAIEETVALGNYRGVTDLLSGEDLQVANVDSPSGTLRSVKVAIEAGNVRCILPRVL
jgi:beta-galactosidase GanA